VVTEIRARDVEFSYPADGVESVPALRGINLDVRAGELLAILGPNGAGKSTLLRLLAGLLVPTRGEVHSDERALSSFSARERARRIAFVPQSLTALPEVTVEAYVGYGRYAHRGLLQTATPADRQAVQAALLAADLDELAARPLAELSGGQRQRALIARALAQEAQTLLVDEPTNALDPEHQLRIFDLLAELCAAGRAVVVVTHDLNLASQFAQRAMLLDAGHTVTTADIAAVLCPEILQPVYGYQLRFGSLPAPRGGGERPFVLPWKRT
jgi:ABC-type cobalamin/Fe3+-siderophores transport system ATPase subunit